MTTLDERYPDLLKDEPDHDLKALVADLDTMRSVSTMTIVPTVVDTSIKQQLAARAAIPAHSRPLVGQRPYRRLRSSGLRTRFTSVGVAMALALGGILGYAHFQAATPVSAAKILHQTLIAMEPPPSGAIHQVTTYTPQVPAAFATPGSAAGPQVATSEQWTEFSPDGTVSRMDSRLSVDGTLEGRQVLNRQASWSYDAKSNNVIENPTYKMRFDTAPGGVIGPKALMFQPQDPALIHSLLLSNSNKATTRLLPSQTLNGRIFDVVQVTRNESLAIAPGPGKNAAMVPAKEISTFFIDASTYIIQRIYQEEVSAKGVTVGGGVLRVLTYQTLPSAQVPAHVFTFTPPSGAHVQNCQNPAAAGCGQKP